MPPLLLSIRRRSAVSSRSSEAPAYIDDDSCEDSNSPENRGPDTYCASQKARDNDRRQEGGIGSKREESSAKESGHASATARGSLKGSADFGHLVGIQLGDPPLPADLASGYHCSSRIASRAFATAQFSSRSTVEVASSSR